MENLKEPDASESKGTHSCCSAATTSTTPSAKRNKSCQVPGCTAILATQDKPSYCIKRSLCHEHIRADAVHRVGYPSNQLWRYCFQCGKLELLINFDSDKRNCRTSLHNRREAASRSKSCKNGIIYQKQQQQQQHQKQLHAVTNAGLQPSWPAAASPGGFQNPGLVPRSSVSARHASTAGTSVATAVPGQVDIALHAAAAAAATELAGMYCTGENGNDSMVSDQVCQAMMAELHIWQQQQQQQHCQQLPAPANRAAGSGPESQFGISATAAPTAASNGCTAASAAVAGQQRHKLLLVDGPPLGTICFPQPCHTAAAVGLDTLPPAAGQEDCYRQLLDKLLADLAATAAPPGCSAGLSKHITAGQQHHGGLVSPLLAPATPALGCGKGEMMEKIAQLELQCVQLSMMLHRLQSVQ